MIFSSMCELPVFAHEPAQRQLKFSGFIFFKKGKKCAGFAFMFDPAHREVKFFRLTFFSKKVSGEQFLWTRY